MSGNNIAHIRNDDTKQTISDHCDNVAINAAKSAKIINAENIIKIAGMLHDVGKYAPDFQSYILGDESFKRGDIDHCFAGAKYILGIANENDQYARATARLIAHIILSHHSLHNWLTDNYEDYCIIRTSKNKQYNTILDYINNTIDKTELLSLFEKAKDEYQNLLNALLKLTKETGSKSEQAHILAFYHGMLERFLESCLVDADRTDTADFMSDTMTKNKYDSAVWDTFHDKMNNICNDFAKKTDPISIRRCDISNRCAAFAYHNIHACRLIVPTGGGKTLSSLRFAIEHCKWAKKKKIIYTAPFMSILEQNSDEWRKITGEDNLTEHHSNIIAEIKTNEELHEYELRASQWDTPVITTTMIQLLNTMFSDSMSCIRRFHTLSDAVIIIDEIQSLPLKCIYMFNLAMNFLSYICDSTIVLCSATQPSVDKVTYPILIDDNASMTGDTTIDFDIFKRTQIIPVLPKYGMNYDETTDFCIQKFNENDNLLIVVNTKSAAREITARLKNKIKNTPIIYLSTDLCPKHRTKKINDLRNMLDEKQPIICVTTQLIEAGVDISFKCVIRSLAGLDSIVQAAGRCNRNKESDKPGLVYVVHIMDENVDKLIGINLAQNITRQIMDNLTYTDYLSRETQTDYFKALYRQNTHIMPYPNEFDANNPLFELLSLNKNRYDMRKPRDCRFMSQAFEEAGDAFKIIDNDTRDVIVPYDDHAKKLIKYLDTDLPLPAYTKYLREVQKYIVTVFTNKFNKLLQKDMVYKLISGAYAVRPNFYTDDYGIDTDT